MTPRGAKKRWLDDVALVWADLDCLRFPFPLDPHGYGNFQDAGRRTVMAHIYVCEQTYGPRPVHDMEAAHSCGQSDCVNPKHLRWATRLDNEADKLIHGTHNRGERQGRAKLTAESVVAIRDALENGDVQRHIAERYSVSEQTISQIKHGRNWSWL